jgi:hypothetical protein
LMPCLWLLVLCTLLIKSRCTSAYHVNQCVSWYGDYQTCVAIHKSYVTIYLNEYILTYVSCTSIGCFNQNHKHFFTHTNKCVFVRKLHRGVLECVCEKMVFVLLIGTDNNLYKNFTHTQIIQEQNTLSVTSIRE